MLARGGWAGNKAARLPEPYTSVYAAGERRQPPKVATALPGVWSPAHAARLPTGQGPNASGRRGIAVPPRGKPRVVCTSARAGGRGSSAAEVTNGSTWDGLVHVRGSPSPLSTTRPRATCAHRSCRAQSRGRCSRHSNRGVLRSRAALGGAAGRRRRSQRLIRPCVAAARTRGRAHAECRATRSATTHRASSRPSAVHRETHRMACT